MSLAIKILVIWVVLVVIILLFMRGATKDRDD